ncbi:MAG TPA: hypothetical protein VGL66_15185 [Caulobacteraceae bacterium]|jgi:hypothetical protein
MAQARPVSVRDIVQMTDPEPPVYQNLTVEQYTRSLISPDGKKFFLIVHTGDLAIDRTVYRLIVSPMAPVRALLSKPGKTAPLPEGRMVATLSTDDLKVFNGAIRDAMWLSDSRHILFIGEAKDGVYQVFQVDAETGRLDQLTHVDNDILTFSYDEPSTTLLFEQRLACLGVCPKPYTDRSSYVVDTMTLSQSLFPDEEKFRTPVYQISMQVLNDHAPPRPVGPPAFGNRLTRTWVSPGGRYAVLERPTHDPATLERWKGIGGAPFDQAIRVAEAGATGVAEAGKYGIEELSVVDLAHDAKELFAAPEATFWNEDVRWSADGTLVFLGNVYAGRDDGTIDLDRVSGKPAVLAVQPATGQVSALAPLAPGPAGQPVDLELTNAAAVSVTQGGETRCYRAEGKSYRQTNCSGDPSADPVALSIRQDLFTPPDLWAEDRKSKRSVRITNLNPALETLTFGKLEQIQVDNGRGGKVTAGLIYPVGYEAGRRYPLVIQTDGWTPEYHFIAGARKVPSAFPGQALASRGMFVLQLPDPPRDGGPPVLEEAAIHQMTASGMVDPAEVGIIGFSHSGVQVLDLMAFSKCDIGAAVVADSKGVGLFSAETYYFNFGGMREPEDELGGEPWGDTLSTWVARDPSLHADAMQAPLLLEAHGLYVLPSWDIYALLRWQKKPAELVVYPHAIHLLRNPRQRFEELEANADWFDFWLQGHEDSDPTKAGQYARWRKMRDERPPRRPRPVC